MENWKDLNLVEKIALIVCLPFTIVWVLLVVVFILLIILASIPVLVYKSIKDCKE